MHLMQMGLSGTVLILVILLLRTLFLHRLPKKVFVVLWGVALVRLLLPYSLSSAVSVYSLIERLAEPPVAAAVDRIPIISQEPVVWQHAASPVSVISAVSAAPHTVAPWMVLWGIGTMGCTVFFMVTYCRCRRIFRESLPVDNAFVRRWLADHPLRRHITVRQSDRITAPLTYGILHPVILVPKTTNWNEAKIMQYVLLHEYVHIRRLDAVTKLFLTAAVSVHWWNPVVWVMYVLANRDIELLCDETVIRLAGTHTKSDYALALLCMEEKKGVQMPLYNHFSKNCMEERIIAIMKIKKTSLAALLAAGCAVVGTTAVFATTAAVEPSEPAQDHGQTAFTSVIEEQTICSYVAEDGTIYYSMDGGKTFSPWTEELEKRYSAPEVEWWTYDAYQAWLEQEKVQLQEMLGEKGWTASRGDFIWTQEMIDETIALYEDILDAIGHGLLVSKTVDGADDIMLAMGTNDVFIAGEAEQAFTGVMPVSYAEYAPFGVTFDETDQSLYYQGEKIYYFEDSVDIGDGAIASRCCYCRKDGTVSLRTVRQSEQNPDSSMNPFGAILRIEVILPDEAERLVKENVGTRQQAATDMQDNTEQILQAYAPFGLTYQLNIDDDTAVAMQWENHAVRSLYDAVLGIWVANSMGEGGLGPDAIELEAVYENGKLAGLRPGAARQFSVTAATAVGDAGDIHEGTPLPDMFQKYEPFGIVYQEDREGDAMERNLYYQGQLVSHFSDIRPDGGVFTFGSTRQGGIHVRTVYDDDDSLTRDLG